MFTADRCRLCRKDLENNGITHNRDTFIQRKNGSPSNHLDGGTIANNVVFCGPYYRPQKGADMQLNWSGPHSYPVY